MDSAVKPDWAWLWKNLEKIKKACNLCDLFFDTRWGLAYTNNKEIDFGARHGKRRVLIASVLEDGVNFLSPKDFLRGGRCTDAYPKRQGLTNPGRPA
jgi:hypothetical protein